MLRPHPLAEGLVGIGGRLVTITGVTGGAMAEVLRRLRQAFAAFWNRQHGSYPPGITIGLLRWRTPSGHAEMSPPDEGTIMGLALRLYLMFAHFQRTFDRCARIAGGSAGEGCGGPEKR